MKLLILDETSSSSVTSKVIYSDFIKENEDIQLIIVTSINALSDKDKSRCLEWIEIQEPSRNAELELIVYELHKKHKIDQIYTKQEDLMLRAAALRQFLQIQGSFVHDIIVYRDKYLMKKRLCEKGVLVGEFELVKSPCDVIKFYELYGKIIVKPIMGSASQGIHLISSQSELLAFLRIFFTVTNQLEYHYEWMVEKFIEGTMYHVNGILKDKKLVAVWPFQYLNTNFGFTKGSFYGNASIQPKDEIYEKLIDITKKVLEALPKCNVFHLELFYSRNEFYVCEIAARRPGGSIGLLIEELVEPRFVEIEFRINNELPIEVTCIDKSIGDILVPKPIGTITKIPDQIPFGTLKVLGKVGDVYTGFDINHLNTLARIVCEGDDVGDVCCKLEKSATEFISLVQYNKLG